MWKPISKKTWKPKPAKQSPVGCSWKGKSLRVHHTVTAFKYKATTVAGRKLEEQEHMRLLQNIAFSRGFNDLSYNYVLFPSGRVYVGRGQRVVGAHTLGYNTHVGVALVGNYDERRVTYRQRRGMRRLVAYLREQYGAKANKVPHCATYATACPGKNARKTWGLSC